MGRVFVAQLPGDLEFCGSCLNLDFIDTILEIREIVLIFICQHKPRGGLVFEIPAEGGAIKRL